MLPVVIIEWNDAVLRHDLNDTSVVLHEPVVLQSCGFLLQSDKDGVTFATDYEPINETYREQSFIPRGMVIKEIVRKTPQKRKKR
jgi:hypothetical protein